MKKFLLIAGIFIVLLAILGKNKESNSSTDSTTTAYEQFHITFKGEPNTEEIARLMDAVLDQYKMEKTELNKNKFASALIAMSKDSAIGVSEMEILKYMYQNPTISKPLPESIALAAFELEGVNYSK